MTRSPNNPACDRASVLARACMQIFATTNPSERRRRIEQYLLDEIAASSAR